MSKRFLVLYEGPIEEFVTTVNAQKVIFHPIKMKGKVDKVGEVYDQNAFNFVLNDSHITPYVPCPEALKQLNKRQKAREQAIAAAILADKVSKLKLQVQQANNQIDVKRQEVVDLLSKAKVVKAEIEDIIDLIPEIEGTIRSLLGLKEKKK